MIVLRNSKTLLKKKLIFKFLNKKKTMVVGVCTYVLIITSIMILSTARRTHYLLYLIDHNNPINGFRPTTTHPSRRFCSLRAYVSWLHQSMTGLPRFSLSNGCKVILFADLRRSPHQIPVSVSFCWHLSTLSIIVALAYRYIHTLLHNTSLYCVRVRNREFIRAEWKLLNVSMYVCVSNTNKM